MRILNTSDGPVEYHHGQPARVINTTAIVEEDLTYEDESPEIVQVLPGGDWCAVVAGEAVALVAFVALDSGRMHGVAIGDDGHIDLTADVEKYPGFTGYKQTSIKEK